MKLPTKISTIVNYVSQIILILLAFLTFLFNYLGLFMAWSLIGFAFIFYCALPLIVNIAATVISIINKNKKMILLNLITFIPYAISIYITVYISSAWFWV